MTDFSGVSIFNVLKVSVFNLLKAFLILVDKDVNELSDKSYILEDLELPAQRLRGMYEIDKHI